MNTGSGWPGADYERVPQFNREYKRLLGEPLIHDLKKMRRTGD